MKQFRVTSITTTDDGRVILNGPSGSLDVFRRGPEATGSSVQRYRTRYPGDLDGPTTHTVDVAEIPDPGPDGICAGIAF